MKNLSSNSASRIDPELCDLVAEWVELPTSGSGYWFLHVAVTHGDNSVTEQWLTKRQAKEVERVAAQGEFRWEVNLKGETHERS